MTQNTLRLITWNINSVRKRLDLVARVVEQYKPHILCLQEIKCTDDQFPFESFTSMGFEHMLVRGQKAYHGVATLARFRLEAMSPYDFDQSGEARDLGVTVKDGPLAGTEIYNLYIPAGGYIADPVKNPKFQQKLNYVSAVTDWGKTLTHENAKRILVGDLNIAPLTTDVYSHEKLKNVVSHTDIERESFIKAMESGEWHDAVRHIITPDSPLFSWWTYREKDWRSANRGRRLDHIWVSQALLPHVTSCQIETEVRGWDMPSDHVPVIMDMTFSTASMDKT